MAQITKEEIGKGGVTMFKLGQMVWCKDKAKVDYYYAWIKPEGATITWQPSVLETYSKPDRWQEYTNIWRKSPKKKSAKVV